MFVSLQCKTKQKVMTIDKLNIKKVLKTVKNLERDQSVELEFNIIHSNNKQRGDLSFYADHRSIRIGQQLTKFDEDYKLYNFRIEEMTTKDWSRVYQLIYNANKKRSPYIWAWDMNIGDEMQVDFLN